MARVQLSVTAVGALERLILTHSLPADTKARVAACLAPLERFPKLGAEMPGRWSGFRFLLGPWRWMILVYVFLDDDDTVVVVTIEDGRSSRLAT